LKLKKSGDVDSTLITALISTKNKGKARDTEMN